MKQANKHPRKTRTYKTTELGYKKAMRRAKKEGGKLATMIEDWVISYGNGMEMAAFSLHYGEIKPLSITQTLEANAKTKNR
jgi:hypothetical protein